MKQVLPLSLTARPYDFLLVAAFNICTLASAIDSVMLVLLALLLITCGIVIYRQITQIKPWLFTVVSLCGLVVISALAINVGLLISMIHLLSLGYVLKLFEIQTEQDIKRWLLSGLLVLCSALIFNQSLYFAVVIAFILVLNIALLFTTQQPAIQPLKALGLSGQLLIQSLPLAIMLFLVFPRLSAFWQMPNTATASTGLSSQLAPGDISRLVQSDDRVFRVSFTAQTPDYHQLYWRALVLDYFDGERWLNRYTTRLQQLGLSSHFQPETAGQPIDYTIIQDPSARHWLFSLASVDINQIKSTLTIDSLPDYTLRSQTPINQLQRYQLRSYLASQRELTLTTTQRVQQTQLQHRRVVNQQLHAWAREMAEQYPDPEQFIAQVLNTIRQQAFRYTLTPPVLVQHNLDQFFFQTKAGFCEHYASAFAYIMRAANIPARVVLGYMGGEYNAQGGYYTIRQYDAHAWVEVWLSGKGWQRVDPTAAISPERIEHGFSERLFEQTSTRTWTQWIALNQQPWFSQAKALFAAIDFKWTTWVVSFNSEKQFTLLQQWLGEISATKIASLLFSTALFSVLLMMLWSFPRIKLAPSTQLKQEFQSLLKYVQALQTTKINTAKLTPLQLQTIVVDPAVKVPWQALCTLYQQYYYQPHDISEQRTIIQRFYQLARPFKWRLRWLRLKHSCGRLMVRFSR